MNNKWIYQSPTNGEIEASKALAEQIGISPVLCHLLRKRGVSTPEEAKRFFRPSLNELHSSFERSHGTQRAHPGVG